MRPATCVKWILFPVLLFFVFGARSGDNNLRTQRAIITNHITTKFPEQLTDPAKKKRLCFCQFGYNLYLVNIPLFPITGFIKPGEYGTHSYGEPGKGEHNGTIYTCRGGFIDMSHVRAAMDWTVYVAFRLVTENGDLDLPEEGGTMRLHVSNLEELSIDDITSIAQRIAFERLTWHEVVSWYHHAPNHVLSEQQSTFTPEDNYSNLLGTVIGKNVALRILTGLDNAPFEQIATEEIDKAMKSLQPLPSVSASKRAYDLVDLNKQLRLPANQRNNDVWWDSKVEFSDIRYVFKRDMDLGPQLAPWLVPNAASLGCSEGKTVGQTLSVPQKTKQGVSLYNYYDLRIEPDPLLFYSKKNGKQVHEPFAAFSTRNYARVINHVTADMEKKLLPGFNKRDSNNPTAHYKRLRKVVFK